MKENFSTKQNLNAGGKIVSTMMPWMTIGCSDKWPWTSLLKCSEVCYNEFPFVNSRYIQKKSKITITSLLNHDNFFRTINKEMDISIVSLFLFHTNVAGQIKGGQHQFIKLSFMIFRYLITLRPRTNSLHPPPPPTSLLSILSCCQTLKNEKQPNFWKYTTRLFPFFPTSHKIMTYLSKGVCSTVAYLGG